MAVRQYIGARYVPVFADEVQWSETTAYDPLTMVQKSGETFMSRQYVPAGAPLPDTASGQESTDYWVHMSNWNAQVEGYRDEVLRYAQEVLLFDGRISGIEGALPSTEFDSENTVADKFETLESILPASAFDSTNTVDARFDAIDARFDAIEADAWVTAIRIATDAIITEKIKDGAVSTPKLADGAVTNVKITNDAVTTSKIADGSITATKRAKKLLVAIGDSWTSEDNPSFEARGNATSWASRLSANKYTVKNYASGASGYYRNGNNGTNFNGQVELAKADNSFENDDVDIVIVYGGINDFNDSSISLQQTRDAMRTTLVNILQSFVNANIYVLIMNTNQYQNYTPDFTDWVTGLNGIASDYNLSVMNTCSWGKQDGITWWNDSLHPNSRMLPMMKREYAA